MDFDDDLSTHENKISYLAAAIETVGIPYLEKMGNITTLRELVHDLKTIPASQRRGGEALSNALVDFLGVSVP